MAGPRAGTEVVHIAGLSVQLGPLLRQRCAWCGAVLLDVDLSRIQVMASQAAEPYPTWETGKLVATSGDHRAISSAYVVEHPGGQPLPEGACGKLDPAVTL